ncbi:gluconokinase [Flavisolibacter nicotianae]|uniref:gluconokinase n=1 Tax=Flavisolibacter nicotianae TaxID=2364882 RepID=UPI000EB12063|nr:gluconokinase [Flavisolibacter nicotianae]
MPSPYIIGIDIGTGSTKAVAVDKNNTVLSTAQHFYEAITQGEKSEQDVHPVFVAFQQSIRQIVDKLGGPPEVISFSSAMHNILVSDSQGEPLTGAILWSDTRSNRVAEALRSSPLGEQIYLATGTPVHSMSPLCKIRWMQECEPALFSKAARFISIKEFIWWQLFGEYVIDHSLASATGLFNVHQLRWEEPALQFAGISTQQLSQPVPVTYTKANAKRELAGEMGLSAETVFMVGASDGTLANLGSRCLRPSDAAVTIGTSAAVRITSPTPVQDARRMIFNYRLDENTFVCGGAVNNGGNVFQWVLEQLFNGRAGVGNYEQLFQLVSQVAAGSNGLLFLPYLHGERAPIWDEKSSGAFIGIGVGHNLAHFARSAAEGVCFALLHILSSLEEVCGPLEQLLVSGGLTHTDVMMQLLANVTGKRVVVQLGGDASAMGAVYLAQKARGYLSAYSEIPVNKATVFQPEAAAGEIYKQSFAVYKNLYPVLKDSMHTLHALAQRSM